MKKGARRRRSYGEMVALKRPQSDDPFESLDETEMYNKSSYEAHIALARSNYYSQTFPCF